MVELNEEEITHLIGLLDGEGYIGISFRRDEKAFLGYAFSPAIQLALGEDDSSYLRYLHRKTRRGQLARNRKSGLVWRLRSQSDCLWLLKLAKKHSKLPTARKRIELLERIIHLLPHGAPLSMNRWTELKPLILQLRALSKKKRNHLRFSDEQISGLGPKQERFGLVGLASEVMVAEPTIVW
jgi:hypothetical protein